MPGAMKKHVFPITNTLHGSFRDSHHFGIWELAINKVPEKSDVKNIQKLF